MAKKLTTAEFIQKANTIHNNKYNYNKVEYTGSHNKVKIICPIHGEFEQLAYSHLAGRGCPKCYAHQGNKEEFIEKSNKIHNNKYDYSLVNYMGAFNQVKIICPEHGEFLQKPRDHTQGCGCPYCSGNMKLTTEAFIKKAKQVHGDKYDYSKVNYINNHTKVCIICPEHGEFWMRPNNHINIQEQGCPICSESKGEKYIRFFLVKNSIKFIRNYKISIDKSINPSGVAKVDFYLPDYNLFIEYNGMQHYIPMGFSGGKIRFEHQVKRDSFIRNYCNNNNIKLVEISYKYDKQYKINELLDNIVFGKISD